MRARSKHITSKGPKLLSVKKGITGWMTQLLKYDSVIMHVSNTERRFCFFWTLIMHWVTTPTPTSIVPTGYVGAGLAKEVSQTAQLSSCRQIQSIPVTEKARTGQHCRFPLACPAQPRAVTLTELTCCALWSVMSDHSSMLQQLGCFAAHIQHALKTLPDSGLKYLSDLIFPQLWPLHNAVHSVWSGKGTTHLETAAELPPAIPAKSEGYRGWATPAGSSVALGGRWHRGSRRRITKCTMQEKHQTKIRRKKEILLTLPAPICPLDKLQL